jgi:hypothetical protein
MVRNTIIALGLAAVLCVLGCQSQTDSGTPSSSSNQSDASGKPSQVDKDKAIKEATQALESWLKLIDDGKCTEAWEQGSKLFKHDSSADFWCKQIEPVRAAFGAVKSRTVTKADYLTHPPKAPEGQYVTLHYDTSFRATDRGIEEVTAVHDEDGVWRAAGYYVSLKPSMPTPSTH